MKEEIKPKKKQPYVEPKVIATYEKEELEDTLKAQGEMVPTYSVMPTGNGPV